MAKKKKTKAVWGWAPAKPPAPTVSTAEKARVEASCQALIEKMKPQWIQPPHETFNYISAIYGKWYRHYYYLCATLKNDSPEGLREMELKFARLEYAGSDRFHLAYFRHTGQWFQVFEALSLEESLKAIEENSFFWP
jgi:hypothetical protein